MGGLLIDTDGKGGSQGLIRHANGMESGLEFGGESGSHGEIGVFTDLKSSVQLFDVIAHELGGDDGLQLLGSELRSQGIVNNGHMVLSKVILKNHTGGHSPFHSIFNGELSTRGGFIGDIVDHEFGLDLGGTLGLSTGHLIDDLLDLSGVVLERLGDIRAGEPVIDGIFDFLEGLFVCLGNHGGALIGGFLDVMGLGVRGDAQAVQEDVPGVVLEQGTAGHGADLGLQGVSWAVDEIEDFDGNACHFGCDLGEFSACQGGSDEFTHVGLVVEIFFDYVTGVVN